MGIKGQLIKLEEILPKLGRQLQDKLMYSINLLRKAEKLALHYDPENGFYNTFSGGKDSQAMYHVMKLAGVKFRTHMSLTSILDFKRIMDKVRVQSS